MTSSDSKTSPAPSTQTEPDAVHKYLNLALLLATGVLLIGLQWKPWGWGILAAGIAHLAICRGRFARHMVLLYISLAALGITPITTEIDVAHMTIMSVILIAAVAFPWLVCTYVYRDKAIIYKLHDGKRWTAKHYGYIAFAGVASYLLLPFYLSHTGAYANWDVPKQTDALLRFFAGTNGLGIWDELFFVITVLGLLRLHFPFVVANLAQAVLFTSFLYELGFTGWGPVMIYPFALLQGQIFRKTDSLLFIIAIHLTIDFVLFLALINAHIPEWANIFIT